MKITGEWLRKKSEEVMLELEPLLIKGWIEDAHRDLFYNELADRINKFMEDEVTAITIDAYEKGYFAGYHSTSRIY